GFNPHVAARTDDANRDLAAIRDENFVDCLALGRSLHRRSERNVAVLLWRVLVALGFQRGEAVDQLRARLVRPDDLVDEAALRRHVRIGELLAVLRDLRRARRRDILRRIEFTLVENMERAFAAHARYFGSRPGDIRSR